MNPLEALEALAAVAAEVVAEALAVIAVLHVPMLVAKNPVLYLFYFCKLCPLYISIFFYYIFPLLV